MWESLRGHQAQIEMFRRAIQRSRTAHAYLFVGPSGIGKKLFAHNMAQALFCERCPDADFNACGECSSCKQIQAGTHPDLLTIGCPEGKRELPIELLIGSREQRGRTGLCHELALRPMSASRRIAIIDDAETMNEASANSLLKTLEEPPPGVILFLIAPDTDPILPTIRSRCQTVRFSTLSEQDIEELLIENGDVQNEAQAKSVSQFAEGNLTTARQLLDSGLLQLKATVENCLKEFPINSLRSVKAINAVFEEIGGDTSQQRQNMRWANQFCIDFLRRTLRETADPTASDKLALMMDRCFEAEQHLKQTMSIPLCLDSLFDDLARISRTPVPV
ncbi:DNA polymerase III subunit delta' [Thalassoglobus polymorphus]|uniref:DNA polymerase III subunit tau n=1 Tax=Thalassoglobus polymorphus TaxID=2527994 RepID=A0A517QNY1_9PLAN|nr:DNA polymerase III subunit delta' [Thalassoglobus polymorphus]QDT33336.1 DNA polymerase III subunit tau [Thalassoglobus polymorphus]